MLLLQRHMLPSVKEGRGERETGQEGWQECHCKGEAQCEGEEREGQEACDQVPREQGKAQGAPRQAAEANSSAQSEAREEQESRCQESPGSQEGACSQAQENFSRETSEAC